MDSMGLTRYMSVLMDDAMKQARFFDHEFVMPEHMLLRCSGSMHSVRRCRKKA